MKLLVKNYHLLHGPRPVTLMRLSNFTGTLMKLVVYSSLLDKQGNQETEQISQQQIYQHLPSKPHLCVQCHCEFLCAPRTVAGIYYPKPIPCAQLTGFLLKPEIQVHKAGMGNHIHLAGRRGPLRRSRSGLQKVRAHLTLPSLQALSPRRQLGLVLGPYSAGRQSTMDSW